MSWWANATVEQKLAQIDGGIECGMTARQIGLNCGATLIAVRNFGNYHGRSFPAKFSSMSHQKKAGRSGGAAKRISTARNFGAPNTLMKDAFVIFDRDEPQRLFNHHPND